MFESIISEMAMLFTYWNTGIDLHETVTGLGNFMYGMQVYNYYMKVLPGRILVAIGVVALMLITIVVITSKMKTKETETEELTVA